MRTAILVAVAFFSSQVFALFETNKVAQLKKAILTASEGCDPSCGGGEACVSCDGQWALLKDKQAKPASQPNWTFPTAGKDYTQSPTKVDKKSATVAEATVVGPVAPRRNNADVGFGASTANGVMSGFSRRTGVRAGPFQKPGDWGPEASIADAQKVPVPYFLPGYPFEPDTQDWTRPEYALGNPEGEAVKMHHHHHVDREEMEQIEAREPVKDHEPNDAA